MEKRHESHAGTRSIALVAALVTLALFWNLPSLGCLSNGISGGAPIRTDKGRVDSWCPLSEVPSDVHDGLDPSSKFLEHSSLLKQAERLSAAVKIPTESWDDNGEVDEDPRWEVFDDLHETLESLFPLVHNRMKLDKVNKYGLLYTYPGSSEDLKPIVFMAHQDVVPATSPEKWSYPPFSGYYDGQWLWGRGSVDCKNNLIGLFSVMEDLLSQGFEPTRTIIFSFGFDEETGGERGAASLGVELEKRWGKDSIAMIVDEGGMGLDMVGDYVYATPGVAEKGYVDIILTIDIDGGHSSRPPPHTGIGIMADFITELERNPYTPRLTQENPFRTLLECQVKYSPQEVEPWLKRALAKNEDEEILGARLAEARADERFILQTSQAVDVIRGGEKVNALPESVTAAVNYRIAGHNSLDKIKQNAIDLLRPIAHKHHLTVDAYGSGEPMNSKLDAGSLTVRSELDLSPAPISPTSLDNAVWSLFSGTIRQVFEDIPIYKGKTVVPVGGIMTGNTDTLHYWNLTRNIYRFGPGREGTRLNAHTIDERIEMNSHVEAMMFYYDLIRNFDQAKHI